MHSLILTSLLSLSVVFAGLLSGNSCDSEDIPESSSLCEEPAWTLLWAPEATKTLDDVKSLASTESDRSLPIATSTSLLVSGDYLKLYAFAVQASSSLASADQMLIAKSFVQTHEMRYPPIEGDQRSDGQKLVEYVEAKILAPDLEFDQNVRRFNQWWEVTHGLLSKDSNRLLASFVWSGFDGSAVPEQGGKNIPLVLFL